jgi:UDP-3-O-[3-hydroxymyristoyl] glucosamine N-acyltransferase
MTARTMKTPVQSKGSGGMRLISAATARTVGVGTAVEVGNWVALGTGVRLGAAVAVGRTVRVGVGLAGSAVAVTTM